MEHLILLVEDSDEDYVAMQRVLQKTQPIQCLLHRCANAKQALAFLEHTSNAQSLSLTLPSLILLDLNLPAMSGRELLVRLKQDVRFKQIPIIALTTSSNPRDIVDCYRQGVNSYQIKPVNFEKFASAIQSLIAYWFGTATLPSFQS